MQITCISWSFPSTKTEAISANCDFIVFTAELLQYSTESHEIKLLWKTRQKKPQNCCMAATASSLPRAVQRPLANYSSISWFLVAYRSKAKITWFAVNTKHSTNCWENTRLVVPQARVLSQDAPALLGFLTENVVPMSLPSFCSFHHFRTASHYQRGFTTYL